MFAILTHRLDQEGLKKHHHQAFKATTASKLVKENVKPVKLVVQNSTIDYESGL